MRDKIVKRLIWVSIAIALIGVIYGAIHLESYKQAKEYTHERFENEVLAPIGDELIEHYQNSDIREISAINNYGVEAEPIYKAEFKMYGEARCEVSLQLAIVNGKTRISDWLEEHSYDSDETVNEKEYNLLRLRTELLELQKCYDQYVGKQYPYTYKGTTITYVMAEQPVQLYADYYHYYMKDETILQEDDRTYDLASLVEREAEIAQKREEYIAEEKRREKEQKKQKKQEEKERKRQEKINQSLYDMEDDIEAYLKKNVLAPMQSEMRKTNISDIVVSAGIKQSGGYYDLTWNASLSFDSNNSVSIFNKAVKNGTEKNLLTTYQKLIDIREKYYKDYKLKTCGFTVKVNVGKEEFEDSFYIFSSEEDGYKNCALYKSEDDWILDDEVYEIKFHKNGKKEVFVYKDTSGSGGGSSGSSGSGSSSGRSSSGSSSGGSASGSSGGSASGSSKKNGEKKYTKTYDDGYEDIWLDDDYDEDEYEHNPDYAAGVDDAMDEYDW